MSHLLSIFFTELENSSDEEEDSSDEEEDSSDEEEEAQAKATAGKHEEYYQHHC